MFHCVYQFCYDDQTGSSIHLECKGFTMFTDSVMMTRLASASISSVKVSLCLLILSWLPGGPQHPSQVPADHSAHDLLRVTRSPPTGAQDTTCV